MLLNYVGYWEEDGYMIPKENCSKPQERGIVLERMGMIGKVIDHNAMWTFVTRKNFMDLLTNVLAENSRSVLTRATNDKLFVKGRILELGCDWGHAWSCFEPIFEDIYGVDMDEPCVKQGQALGRNITLCSMDDTPFDDNYFDVVISRHVLEHGVTAEKTLREIHRITKPHGWSVHTLPCTPDNIAPPPNDFHSCSIPVSEWKKSFIDTGFEIVRDYFGWALNQEEWSVITRKFNYES